MVDALNDFRIKLSLLQDSAASAHNRTKCRNAQWDSKGTDMDASRQMLSAVRCIYVSAHTYVSELMRLTERWQHRYTSLQVRSCIQKQAERRTRPRDLQSHIRTLREADQCI
jgi:hypothetical protein